MASTQANLLQSTDKSNPKVTFVDTPETFHADRSYAISQLVKLAKMKTSDKPRSNDRDITQLPRQASIFLDAVASANMSHVLFNALDHWHGETDPTKIIEMLKEVVEKFAAGNHRNLVDQFLMFLPIGWRQDPRSLKGGGPLVAIWRPDRKECDQLGRYPDGCYDEKPRGLDLDD